MHTLIVLCCARISSSSKIFSKSGHNVHLQTTGRHNMEINHNINAIYITKLSNMMVGGSGAVMDSANMMYGST